uniref:Peptidase M10 metallopeptidase domain-containing protein n=1 Tax=Panagrolaimus sp. ES5 TaxID=591445 RepID=A0AC34FD53_9BILA
MFKMLKLVVTLLYFQLIASEVAPTKEQWSKQTLTYSVLKFPTKMNKKDTLAALKNAFNQWSKIAPKKFKKFPKNHTEADFTITFVSIDGPGGKMQR